MTSKPDDIPRDVWETAVFVASFTACTLAEFHKATSRTALAILAERKRCSDVAQKLYDDWNRGPASSGSDGIDGPPTAADAASAIMGQP